MKKKFRTILLFGAPGSGKGTVGKELAHVTEQFHLSSGDIFRGMSPVSALGKLQSRYTSQGLLVPDDVTVQIFLRYVQGLEDTNRFFPEKQCLILDGIPRTLEQAKLLDDVLDVEKVLVLDVHDEEVLLERLRKRAKIQGRTDDLDDAVLKKRMEVYHEKTEKMLAHYSKEICVHIHATQTPTQVLRDVLIELAHDF